MSTPLATLSIDLAYTRHSDIGVALLHQDAGQRLHARGVPVPLSGTPQVDSLADWIDTTALAHDARCLCIDGPLAWQGDDTPTQHGALHSRLCERLVNAPGKTGLPNHAKPRPYLPFTQFSIALALQLIDRGWVLADASASSDRVLMESFPTAAWRALGLAPLPGKARAGRDQSVLDAAQQRLRDSLGLTLTDVRTHDDIQAVVGGIAGAWWTNGYTARVQFVGAPPVRALDGTWREGYIILPVPSSSVPA